MANYSAVEINRRLTRLGRIVGEPTMNGGVKATRLLMGLNLVAGFVIGCAVTTLIARDKSRKR